MSAKKRVLIIALDGFTWKLARPFLEAGVMPHLAKMVREGSHGTLKSVIPFETSPAWSAFQTGCLPGKTTVLSFHRYDRSQKKVRLNSFADIAVPSIWELADRMGKTVVSLNMPVTSPPPKVRGVIIPGLLCPKFSPETVHPPQAYDKYIKPHKDYLIVNNDRRDTVAEFTEQAIATERVRCGVALELMKDVDWDIFCVQIQSSDALQHKIWWALDPESPDYSEEGRNEALSFYRGCDEIIGQLVETAGPDNLTVVVSDHGFCLKKADIGINTWLRQHGYLQYLPKEPPGKLATAKERLKGNLPLLKMLARMYGNIRTAASGRYKQICDRLKKPGSTRILAETVLSHMRTFVDFEKTRAFCLGGMAGMVYINGSEQERKELATKLTAQLLAEFGPDSPEPVITSIRPAGDVYGGAKEQDFLPDLVIEFVEGYEARIHPGAEEVIVPGVFNGQQQGTHDRNGIFVVNGPGVEQGTEFNAEIVDIAPTVLAYLDIAVPQHMDGKVMNEAFSSPLSVIHEDVSYDSSSATEYTDDEQAEVERNLRDIGYI